MYKEEPKQTQQLQIEQVEKVESCAEAPKLPVMAKSEPSGFKPSTASFNFYGNNVDVRYDRNESVRIGTINEQSISDMWDQLSKTNYSCTVTDLLKWQSQLNMNDWGFYMLTKQTVADITSNQNSRVLLTWFLLTKANYKARLAYKGNNLYLLLAAANNIYGMPYFTFDNQRYYLLEGKANNVYTYNRDFPEARSIVDLNIYKPLNGNESLKNRKIDFKHEGEEYEFSIRYDQNTINFYNDYPQADIKIYFDATVSRATKESLTEALMPVMSGMSAVDATEFLLKFVQSFAYKTDDQQFGHEKFFFPDEMFYYPYSDCEDRSVLFAYLVKQLVGLDVIGLNYPGHMATAVCFNSNVEGSYIEHNGRRYTICDPTYIGAPVGLAMPQFAKVAAKIVENASQPNLASRAVKLWKVANKYGLHQGDNKHNIVFDGNGDAYMCGYFEGDVDFMGRHLSADGTDIFIAKITSDNDLGFLYRIGSKSDDVAYNIVLSDDDCFYFSGSFNGEMTVAGQRLKTRDGDFFIAKCSRDGKLAWINQTNIGQMDSINNTFAAQFDKNGKRLWTRTYAESEDMTDYGIHVDNDGNPFLCGTMLAAVGLSNKSYESMARHGEIHASDINDVDPALPTAPAIAGLMTIVEQAVRANSLPGKTMQHDLTANNPEFSSQSPDLYNQFGNIELIRNGMGIVTVRTSNREPVVLNTVKLENNSKLKISVYSTGNATIEFLSGSEYGSEQAWRPLNSLKLYRTSGNLTFDYDTDHTHKTVNAEGVF
ncbi:MAG: hypothetical protein IJ911_06635 [Salinivirgaceae bacterium]|nr:hypothetical protein [Salinivirgaceae bacterium]